MLFKFELEGGNFSKAGYASSQIKKVLKQLAIDPRIIKRVVVALYEAEVNIVEERLSLNWTLIKYLWN